MVVLALPDLLLIVGIAALLLMANATKGAFVKPVADLLSAIPVIGGQLADVVSQGWDGVVAGLQQNLNDAVGLLTGTLDLVHGAYQLVLNGVTGTAEWLGYWTGQAIGGLGDLGNQLGSQIASILAAAVKAGQDALKALQQVGTLFNQVQTLVQTGIQDLIDASLQQFQATVNDLIKAALVPVHAAIHSVRLLVHQFHSVEVAARTAADAQLGQAIDNTRAQLNTRIHGVEGDVAALDTRTGSIEGEIGDILGEIGTIAAGTTLVGLITQVATKVTTMERECVDPTCSFLGPQLDLLNALADVETLALVAAMVASAVQAPGAAGRDGAGQVASLAPTFLGMFNGITGAGV